MPLPPEFQTASGPAIVLGRSEGWLEDLDRALDAGPCASMGAPIFAVNGSFGYYPGLWPVEHVVSVHCHQFPKERGQTLYHTCKPVQTCANSDVQWPLVGIGGDGSSALLAVAVALLMGHAPVFVAGVRLTAKTIDVDSKGKRSFNDYRIFQQGWTDREDLLRGKVFSMAPAGTFLTDLLGGYENG